MRQLVAPSAKACRREMECVSLVPMSFDDPGLLKVVMGDRISG
jgi:hypothetical protein